MSMTALKVPAGNMLHVALGLQPLQPGIPESYPLKRFWHVVYTGMRSELDVRRDLKALGFDVFLPMSTRKTVKRGKKVIINDPLFTRYIFVAFDREKDDWGSILSTDGVEYILGANDLPSTVPETFIERVQRLEDAGAFDYTRAKLNFTEGDRVEIQEGPFAGLIARVKSASPKKRVRLLLDSLASIEIDPSLIVRV